MDEMRVEFVDFEGFLEGALDMGLSFDDGVKEIFDNSIDAGAKNIILRFMKLESGAIRVIIEDDGVGIPLFFLDEDDKEKYGIPFVMAFGNRGKGYFGEDGRFRQIGRFGYGLSQTITCLAKKEGHAEIWSKRQEDEEWRRCWYDYPKLKESKFILPPEESWPMPPVMPTGNHGTIVMIDIPDPEVHRVGAIQNRFMKFIGRTYRKHLADGLRVSVISIPLTAASKIKPVRISDPLSIMPGSDEVVKFGPAVEYDPVILTFDGSNGFPAFTNPQTGEHSQILFTLTRMRKPVVADRLHEEFLGKSHIEKRRILNRWGIGDKGQGFSLLREGREISSGKTFGIYNKHTKFNYMHGELEFDSGLDEVFRVRTNKSRFHVSDKLRELLREAIGKTIAKIRDDHETDNEMELEVDELESGESEAERLAREASHHLPRPPLDENQKKEADEMRVEARVEMEEKARRTFQVAMEEANAALEEAQTEGHHNSIEEAQSRITRLRESLDVWIERIERRFASRAPARINREPLEDGSVYNVDDRGDEARITINTHTNFHENVYGALESDKNLRTVVDLMLMSMGYAEFIHCKEEPHEKDTWVEARREVSTHLLSFVREMGNGGDA